MIMTSREFSQNTSLAQKYAQNAPVIITNRGKPAYVLVKYEDFGMSKSYPKQSIADALVDIASDCADIDLPLPARSQAQREPVDFGDDWMYLLDTNVISEMRKIKNGKANANVVAWLSKQTVRFLC